MKPFSRRSGRARASRAAALLGLAAILPCIAAAPAMAADKDTFLGGIQIGRNAARWEIRAGVGDYDTGPFSARSFTGATLNAEVLAPSPDFLGAIGAPRPYFGTDIALSDNPIHAFYAGLNWDAYLTGRLYLGFSAGGAVMSKSRERRDADREKDLGSDVLFHLQASIGYDLTDHLTAQVYLNHFSNADIGGSNDGLESVGARLGYRF